MKAEDETTVERENPRTRRVRQVILDAAMDLLLEQGAHCVTAATVAERADVARTTVYRHWPDQRSLLLATIEAMTKPHVAPPTEGPLQECVRTGLTDLRTRITRNQVRTVFGALAGFAAQDDAFRDAQRLFIDQLTQPMVATLAAAKERGELHADVDCAREASLLVGPLLHQHLAVVDKISDELIEDVAQRWLAVKR